MNRYFFFIIVLTMGAGMSRGASANPVSCEAFRVRQVPQSQHVQVTFGEQCNQEVTVLSLMRDGTSFEPHWNPVKEFVANMGSGLETMDANQTCDCNVALGEHQYKIKLQIVDHRGEIYKTDYDLDLEVLDPAALEDDQAAEDAGEDSDKGSTDDEPMGGWDIPEPEEVQGIDCVSLCKNAASDPGSTDPGATEQAADNDSSLTTGSDGDESSDCSVANDLGAHGGFSKLFAFILSCYLL